MKQPNVILCVCDQLRAFETGCYGNRAIRTPHIDGLAAGSVRFEVAVTSRQPGATGAYEVAVVPDAPLDSVYLDDEIADGEASQSARGVHDRMWDKIVGIK